jgi:hypothetical protein
VGNADASFAAASAPNRHNLHTWLVVLSGDFSGDHDDFYEALEAQPDVLSGRFPREGIELRCEELPGADAGAGIKKHFVDWPQALAWRWVAIR